jgi:hypothetical protein
MKTNQIMHRQMGSFDVQQRTKDGMFNATVLLQQWNETLKSDKRIFDFLSNSNTKEFIAALLEDINNQQVPNDDNCRHLEQTGNQQDTKRVYQSARGHNGGVWMHPLLFMKFAMWLNPRFELQVLKFVQDKMLEYRNLACESYKELSTNVAKLVPKDLMESAMRRVARGVNYVVFNTHNPGERNLHATDDEQMKLFNFQNSISFTIKTGLIKTYEQLINFLRDRWMEAWDPFQRDLALKEAKSNLITA